MQGNWVNDYIGLPYLNNGRDRNGIDCWGLVRLVHKEVFNNDLPAFSDVTEDEIKQEVINIEKENWNKVQVEEPGDVVLFKVAGQVIHVGVVVKPCLFLHAFNGSNTCVESLSSIKWNKRVVGIYRYSKEASTRVSAVPNPLKTKVVSKVLPENLSIADIAKRIQEDEGASADTEAVILVDGRVIPKEYWETTIPPANSRIEYRAVLRGGNNSVWRIIATIVVAVVAWWVPTVGLGMTTTSGGLTAGGAALSAAITIAGSMLINAIFPIRPPVAQEQSTENGNKVYGINGSANQLNPYGSIPVVLGKIRYTPPTAIQSYIEADGTVGYLRSVLCWGYGPLAVNLGDMKIGTTSVSSYSNIEYQHLTGYPTDNKTEFERLCNQDVEQKSIGVSLDPELARVKYAARSSNVMTVITREQNTFEVGSQVTFSWYATGYEHTGTILTVNNETSTITFSNPGVDQVYLDNLAGNQAFDWYIQAVKWVERSLEEEVTQLKINLEFPNGLFTTNQASGAKSEKTFRAFVQVKKTSESTWQDRTNIIPGKYFSSIARPVVAKGESITTQLYIVLNKDKNLALKYESYDLDDIVIYSVPLTSSYLGDDIWYTYSQVLGEPTRVDTAYSGFEFTKDNNLNITIADGYKTGEGAATFDITKKMLSPFTQSVVFDVESGYYDIRVIRISRLDHDSYDANSATWATVTGFSNRKPITFPKPLCMTAVRAKATNQFNSNVEGFNTIVSSICLDYDAASDNWIERETNNPASLYRYVLQHPANARPLPDSKIDLAKLKEWHIYCARHGFTFNNVYDNATSLTEVLKDVAAAGRASVARVDGKHTVVIDDYRDTIVQHFTPHNSWGFEGSKTLPKLPHGFRVQFRNETKDYQQDEMIVYNDGYNESNAEIFEGLVLPGVTNPNIIYKQARFHLAQIKLRPETYTINADIEHIVCNRGSLVKVAHDVPMWGLGTGRVRTKINSTTIHLGESLPMQSNKSYSIRLRAVDGSSVVRSIVPVLEDGYYDTISVTVAFADNEAQQDDVFMFGDVNTESVDLIVLSIEPAGNMTAKITLVDYSPGIYTSDTEVIPAFNSKISLPAILLRQGITEVPVISSLVSDDTALVETTPGKFVQGLSIQFRNSTSLPSNTSDIELQWDWAGDTTTDWFSSSLIPISKGSYTIMNTEIGDSYTLRARYVDNLGRSGPWSSEVTTSITGRTRPPSAISAFIAEPSGTDIKLIWQTAVEQDVRQYEVRTTDSNWGTNASDLVYLGSSTVAYTKPTYGSNTYYVRSISDTGLYSDTTSTTYSYGTPPNTSNIIESFHDTSITTASITLDWAAVTTSNFGVAGYEVSYDSVTKFTNSTTITLPADWIGNRTFTVKTVDNLGNKSSGYSKSITKLYPNAPYNAKVQVIDNTVMLYWTNAEKTTLPIAHVMLRKGATFETSTIIGPKSGGFTTVNELQAGVYTYWLSSVDTDGYESAPVAISTMVNQPPDFVYHGELFSTFDATKVNAIKTNEGLVMLVNASENFQQHFDSNSWSSPNDQVNAGYPIYIQPGVTTSSYTEVFDFGTTLASSRISLNILGKNISGTAVITTDIEISNDNATWEMHANTSDIFVTNFRYARVKLSASGSNTAVYLLSSLSCRADAKQANDSGRLYCNHADSQGTIFNFSREFIDVVSLTATANTTSAITAVIDFIDTVQAGTYSITSNVLTVNATAHGLLQGQHIRLSVASGSAIPAVYSIASASTNSFTINTTQANTSGNCTFYPQSARMYLFDSAGSRVSANASWSVRGY